jgi:hypothetical protein
MEFLLLILLMPYATIFILAQLMGNWKWLVIYAALLGSLLSYGYLDYLNNRAQPDYHGTPGDMLVIPIFMFGFASFFSAVVTRAIVLYLKYKNYPFRLQFLVSMLGFLSIIPLMYVF